MPAKKKAEAAPAKEEQPAATATEETTPAPEAPVNVMDRVDKEEAEKHLAKVVRERKGEPSQQKHDFWNTQPVLKYDDREEDIGPLETKTVDEVLADPLNIASTFEWFSPDPRNEDELHQIYELLRDNYVEDDDSMFRFNYSHEFLRWALMPPGFFPDWHVGVRKRSDKKMLAFISGIPITLRMGNDVKRICEINFLCVHKNLREKRMSPILIKEVTRRVNLRDMWQAVYTAGIVLPKPFASAQYFHRSLNPQKLIAINFSRIPSQFEKFSKPMDMVKKHYAVATKTQIKGLRVMETKDIPAVTTLLNSFLNESNKFAVSPVFDEAEVKHWLMPIKGVVFSYVVENAGNVTDFLSFYNLPSTVIGHPKYNSLNAAYTYYYVARSVSTQQLMSDALILAKEADFDVFNTLDILDNEQFISNLKFGPGDGRLQYYFYNWKFPAVDAKHVGLVML